MLAARSLAQETANLSAQAALSEFAQEAAAPEAATFSRAAAHSEFVQEVVGFSDCPEAAAAVVASQALSHPAWHPA